jgi:hypothetical protein
MKRRIRKAPRYSKVKLPDDIVASITDLTQAVDTLGNAIVALSEGKPAGGQLRARDAAYLLQGVLFKMDTGGDTAELLCSEFSHKDTVRVIKRAHESLDALAQAADKPHKRKATAEALVDAMGMITSSVRSLLFGRADVGELIEFALEDIAVALTSFHARNTGPKLLTYFPATECPVIPSAKPALS